MDIVLAIMDDDLLPLHEYEINDLTMYNKLMTRNPSAGPVALRGLDGRAG